MATKTEASERLTTILEGKTVKEIMRVWNALHITFTDGTTVYVVVDGPQGTKLNMSVDYKATERFND